MKNFTIAFIACLVLPALWPAPLLGQAAAFTYQGEILDNGTPVDGALDFTFALFDAASVGNPVGPEILVEDLAVANGLFSVDLDFGVTLDATPLWLEIRFRDAVSVGAFATLNPRRPLTLVPETRFSREAGDADTVDGEDANDLLIQSVNLNGKTLEITEGNILFTQDLSSLTAADGDTDDTNELNTGLALNGTAVEITDSGGTLSEDLGVLRDGVDDADVDPNNEIISSAALVSNILTLIEGGTVTNLVDLTALLNSAVELDGTTLRLTEGANILTADLSVLQDGVDDADANPANELNTGLVLNGTDLELTDANGTLTADLSTLPIDDADADPTNELITATGLTNTNDTLVIVEGGITNLIDIAALQNSALTFDGANVSLTDGGGTLATDLSSLIDDADANPANELNATLALNGDDLELTDPGGTLTVDLSPLRVDDADADPTNELITAGLLTNANDTLEIVEGGVTNQVDVTALQNSLLAFDGANVSLTDGGETLSTDLSALTDDADANPANELNTTLVLNGTDLELTDPGGTLAADLSGLPIDDADADSANELITNLTLTNNNDTLQIVEGGVTNDIDVSALQNSALNFDGNSVSLTDGGGTLSANISGLTDDADANPANELNTTLVLNGNDLELTDAGGTIVVDLSPLQDGVTDADADTSNELITSVTLTDTNDNLRIVEAGVTNDVDVTTLKNVGLVLSGTALELTDGAGTLSADLSSLDDQNTALALNVNMLSLTDSAGTLTVDLSAIDGANDLDTSSSNELITNATLTAANVLEITEAGNLTSVDLSSLATSDAVGLYDNAGWSGASGVVDSGAGSTMQKILEIVETATSNRFEVDFNRLVPGVIITNIPITISQPGNYYLVGSLTNTTSNADGITIDASDVTLDLMGFSVVGSRAAGISSDDGIYVRGSETNVKVHNGTVHSWDGDGINALNADFSIWSDLHVRGNGQDGLVTDFNNLVVRVTATTNGADGIDVDDGTVIFQCTAGENDEEGIQTSEGCKVAASTAYDNRLDGFSVSSASVVDSCVSKGNGLHGFDMSLGTAIVNSSAMGNGSNGIDLSSSALVRSCISSDNGGHGILTQANTYVRGNRAYNNTRNGIMVDSIDVRIDGNFTSDNGDAGIGSNTTLSLFVRNISSGNTTNYNLPTGNSYGPIIDASAGGDLTTFAGSDHPWANFVF